MSCLIVLIPAYQPDEQLIQLVNRFQNETDFCVIVVNDGSASEKQAVFDSLPKTVTVLEHQVNQGKGRAMKTGMEYILEKHPTEEGVVVVDADGQHLLPDVIRVCEELKSSPDALILGSRQFTGQVPFRSKAGNTITRHVFALASGIKVYDTQTGLRAFSVSRIPELLSIKGERYEYEMNMLLGAAEKHIPVKEVYIETVYLDEENSSSHFHPIRDSARIYGCILKFILPSIFKFGSSSVAAFLIDYSLFLLLNFLLKGSFLSAGIQLLLATVISRGCSSVCNFTFNRLFVFKSKDKLLPALLKYYGLVLIVLALNYPLLYIFNLLLSIPVAVSKLMVEVILFLFNFTIQRLYIFKNKM